MLKNDENRDIRKNTGITLYRIACAVDNTIKFTKHGGEIIIEALVRIIASEDHFNEAILNAVEILL